MSRIGLLFEKLKKDGRKGMIAYLTAGDPSPDRTPALVEALVRGGADLIELGVPFSDPIADGPVIQRGGERALKAGTTLRGVLDIASQIRATSEVPLLLFTYLNPVMRYGLEASSATGPRRFDQRCAGIDADDFASVGRQHSGQPAFAAPDVDHAARTLAQHRLHDRGIRAGTAARDLSFAHRIRPRRRIAIPAPLHARGGIVEAFA